MTDLNKLTTDQLLAIADELEWEYGTLDNESRLVVAMHIPVVRKLAKTHSLRASLLEMINEHLSPQHGKYRPVKQLTDSPTWRELCNAQ